MTIRKLMANNFETNRWTYNTASKKYPCRGTLHRVSRYTVFKENFEIPSWREEEHSRATIFPEEERALSFRETFLRSFYFALQ